MVIARTDTEASGSRTTEPRWEPQRTLIHCSISSMRRASRMVGREISYCSSSSASRIDSPTASAPERIRLRKSAATSSAIFGTRMFSPLDDEDEVRLVFGAPWLIVTYDTDARRRGGRKVGCAGEC